MGFLAELWQPLFLVLAAPASSPSTYYCLVVMEGGAPRTCPSLLLGCSTHMKTA